MDIFETVLAAHGGDRVAAAIEVGRDLMRDDPGSFKAGYTAPNAAWAVCDLYHLTEDEHQLVFESLS